MFKIFLLGIFVSRVFRIGHEKLSEGSINGSTERGPETGHRNYEAAKGGYATSNSSGNHMQKSIKINVHRNALFSFIRLINAAGHPVIFYTGL